MKILADKRRREISRLFHDEKYTELYRFGIKMISEGGNYDCGTYVCRRLGIPSHPSIISVIQNSNYMEKPEENSIIRYRSSKRVEHYGIYENGRVTSKWGLGPVFSHNIQDVPDIFGDIVEFHKVDENLLSRFQELMLCNE